MEVHFLHPLSAIRGTWKKRCRDTQGIEELQWSETDDPLPYLLMPALQEILTKVMGVKMPKNAVGARVARGARSTCKQKRRPTGSANYDTTTSPRRGCLPLPGRGIPAGESLHDTRAYSGLAHRQERAPLKTPSGTYARRQTRRQSAGESMREKLKLRPLTLSVPGIYRPRMQLRK